MPELLEFAFSGINLIPTVLLLFVMIYWSIVILGLIDMDAVDIDIDVEAGIGNFASVLSFFNIGHMPLMIFITFFAIPQWMITLMVNDFLGFHSWQAQIFVFAPTFLGSLFVAKFLTIPIARFYRSVKNNTEAIEDIVGKICTAKLKVSSERVSQAEIKVEGTSVLISVKTQENEVVEKGNTALIIEKSNNHYIIEPYTL